jgi:hypothetical protein
MKAQSRIKFALRFLMTLALAGSFHGALAQPTGTYDLLTFPGCTGYSLNSTAGVTQPGPSNYVETMTDGLGNVVFSQTATGGIGTFTVWNGFTTFTLPPQQNPIHELIVMDGVVIANLTVSSTCFATPVPASTPTTLVVLAALLSLVGVWAIRRKWSQSRSAGR